MKKNILLFIFAILAVSSCSKRETSNVSANNPVSSNNSLSSNNYVNANSNFNTTNGLSQNPTPVSKSEVNSEMLKQIEAQQLETADPRKAAKQNSSGNSNQSAPKTAPAGRQTW